MEGSKDQVELLMMYEEIKKERDELSKNLEKECNDNYKLEGQLHDMTKQHDSLIKDVGKLREELRMHVQCNDELGRVIKLKEQAISGLRFENDSLRLQADEYFESWQNELEQRTELSNRWSKLDDYVKERREVNPASIQYIKIEGMIRELEKDK
ncbi:hypothetical protein [Mammaliicoccus sciuri]|uniref:hypothetical protein n=1 Tax=Mammaliicoccus sciuri TaxID=1296 RepID=UPI000D1F211C|nr:hypothetical protein [Mammaliicoccus sciuri]PTJ54236.1 hypothetical protein BU012_01165 [Mammaliicoccus sciuri]